MSTDQYIATPTLVGTSWTARVRRLELWSTPPRARAFMLTVEVAVAALVVLILLRTHWDAGAASRAGLLVVLSILYAEAANRVDLLRRYLHLAGRGQVWSNPTSVWTFAAGLLLPAGYAATVVMMIYAHIYWRSRRHRLGRSYQIVFGATTTLLGIYAAITLQELTGVRIFHGGAAAAGVALLALLGYTLLSLAATVTAVYLVREAPTWRAVVPGADAIGFEVATLTLGVVTATVVLTDPWFVPMVFVLIAVLHRSTLVSELEGAARTDAKTGLLNANAWRSLADQHLLRAERQNTPVAVLMIDLDHFKMINDEFGHLAGDRTLQAVSVCLKEELRGYDAVARFGGEEFIALLDGVAPDTATSTAVRITHAICALTPAAADDGCARPITASIGVASYPGDGTSIDALTAAADTAMYTAKAAGRNCVRHAANNINPTGWSSPDTTR